ncbi:MAG: ABC transporter substrate-binding protein [Acidimicrobiales bacterium]|nr:ABC transporter substrate-binding protein [Acidimicrobiales bacterium]
MTTPTPQPSPTQEPASASIDIPVTTRSRTYVQLVGAVSVMLALGLALPALVGERPPEQELSADADLDLDAFGGGDAPATDGAPVTTSTSVAATEETAPVAGDGVADDGGSAVVPDGGQPAPTDDGSTTTTVANTASDIGVTADTIKIGLLVPTSSEIGSTTDQRDVQVAEFMAAINTLNENGGIHGRTIEVVDATYDVLDQDSGTRASCLKLADDEKVFAAFNTTGYGPPGALCLTREKGVPFLQGSGHPEEIYGQANGLYSSTFDNQTRNFRNMVQILHDLGAIKGKKVGVLGTEWIGLRREQEEGIVDTLKALGYDPFVYWLSGDPVSSQTQIPIAVQQMRSKKVDAVLLGADFLSGQSFAQTAATQGYTPFYGAADPWSYSTDFVTANMPASFDGSITTTAWRSYDHRAGQPEPALDATCAQDFEDDTGIQLNRENDPDALYTGTLLACGVVQRFEMAANAAGPHLTRASLMQAMGNLGTFDMPFAGGPGTYTADKLDGADFYRPQVWKKGCKCWHPIVPDFTRGKH